MRVVLCLLLLSPGITRADPTHGDEAVGEEPLNAAVTSSPQLERDLIARLSVRDPEPNCDEVTRDLVDPHTVLRHVVDTVQMPPWAPMRAASCLLTYPGSARRDALDWVTHPEKRGLALMVLARIDGFPRTIGLEISQTALAGPWADDANRLLKRSSSPSIRGLLTAHPDRE